MLQVLNRAEEPADLFAAEDDGQLLRLATAGDDLLDVPVALEGDVVKEAKGCDRHHD